MTFWSRHEWLYLQENCDLCDCVWFCFCVWFLLKSHVKSCQLVFLFNFNYTHHVLFPEVHRNIRSANSLALPVIVPTFQLANLILTSRSAARFLRCTRPCWCCNPCPFLTEGAVLHVVCGVRRDPIALSFVYTQKSDLNVSHTHRIGIPAYGIEQQRWQLGDSKNEMSLMSFIYKMMLVLYQSGLKSGVISNIYWHASKFSSISFSHWQCPSDCEFSFLRFVGLYKFWSPILWLTFENVG
jgi:hypothetical protein